MRTLVVPYILYDKVYNSGRTQSNRPCSLRYNLCKSMEHFTRHKMRLQIVNAIFICSGIDA